MQQELFTNAAPDTAVTILDRVYSKDRLIRAEAQAELSQGRVQDIETLIAVLERENKKKPVRFAIGVVLAYIPIIVLSILAHTSGMAGSMTMVAMGAGAAF